MEAVKYQKRITEFDAIQFTGGEENGREVVKWLYDVAKAGAQWGRVVPGQWDAHEEWISLGARRFAVGAWFTVDSLHHEFTAFTDEEFQKMFAPVQEFDVSEERFEESSEESALHFTEDGIEEATVAEMREPRLEKFELNGLFSIEGVLHGRRMDNGEFVPIVIWDDKPTLIDHPECLTEISNGVIDGVKSDGNTFRSELTSLINKHSLENNSDTPDFMLAEVAIRALENFNEATSRRSKWYGKRDHIRYESDTAEETQTAVEGDVGADYIIERTKYNEDTLEKVATVLMQTVDGLSIGKGRDVISNLQNAGILFRERV